MDKKLLEVGNIEEYDSVIVSYSGVYMGPEATCYVGTSVITRLNQEDILKTIEDCYKVIKKAAEESKKNGAPEQTAYNIVTTLINSKENIAKSLCSEVTLLEIISCPE